MKIRAAIGAVFLLPAIANATLVTWEFNNMSLGSAGFDPAIEFAGSVDGTVLWETDGSNFDLLGASFSGDEFAFTMNQGSGDVDLTYQGAPGGKYNYWWRGGADATGDITNWRGDEVSIPANLWLSLESDVTPEPGDPIRDQIWKHSENYGLFDFNIEGVRAPLAFTPIPDKITVLTKVPEPATIGLLGAGLALISLRRRII